MNEPNINLASASASDPNAVEEPLAQPEPLATPAAKFMHLLDRVAMVYGLHVFALDLRCDAVLVTNHETWGHVSRCGTKTILLVTHSGLDRLMGDNPVFAPDNDFEKWLYLHGRLLRTPMSVTFVPHLALTDRLYTIDITLR